MPAINHSAGIRRVVRQSAIGIGLVGFMYFSYGAMVSYVETLADRQAAERYSEALPEASTVLPSPARIDGLRDPFSVNASPREIAAQQLNAAQARLARHRRQVWRQSALALGVPIVMLCLGVLAFWWERRRRRA